MPDSPHFDALESLAVPVDTVLDWWYSPQNPRIPKNYRVCDGSRLDYEGSVYHTHVLPDLRNQFIRGASFIADGDGVRKEVPAKHAHTYKLTGHRHDLPMHHHLAAAYDQKTNEWKDGQGRVVTAKEAQMSVEGSGAYPIAWIRGGDVNRILTGDGMTESDGKMVHTGKTPDEKCVTEESTNDLPPHACLVKIIRVI